MSHFNRNEIRRNGGERNRSASPENWRYRTRHNDNFRNGRYNQDYYGPGTSQESRNDNPEDGFLRYDRYTSSQGNNFPFPVNRQIYETPINHHTQLYQSGGYESRNSSPRNFNNNYDSPYSHQNHIIGQYINAGPYHNFQSTDGNQESPFNYYNERPSRPVHNSSLNPYASPFTPSNSRPHPVERQEKMVSRNQETQDFGKSKNEISTSSQPSIRHGPVVPPIQ